MLELENKKKMSIKGHSTILQIEAQRSFLVRYV